MSAKIQKSDHLFISAVAAFSEVQPGPKSGRDQSRAAGGSDKPRGYGQLSGGTGKPAHPFTKP